MTRYCGTVARGLLAPIVKKGDNLIPIVVDTVLAAGKGEGITFRDRDVVAVTESLVARVQNNYVSIEAITKDLNEKYDDEIAVVFPIMSRNRFYLIMKAIAQTGKKIKLFFSYPSDEVGNPVMDIQILHENNINPYQDTLDEAAYRRLVGEKGGVHLFTGINYIDLYKETAVNDNIEIYFTNNPLNVLDFTDEILVANIHDRNYLKTLYQNKGAKIVYTLADIMNAPIDNSGYNPEYGLYGSNLASPTSIKLFPRDAQTFADTLAKELRAATGVAIEAMVYGDGAFRDPVGKIWELADPVVSPGFTEGLNGTPNEIKLKYVADNALKNLDGKEAKAAMQQVIREKADNSLGEDSALGTTPRQITDLLGSLSDLISGSGDKGTPIVLIQGYFDNYAS